MTIPNLEKCEEIKFIGTYDRTNPYVQKIPGYNGGSAGYVTEIAGLDTNTFISNQFIANQTNLLGGPVYADESYSMVSYPNNNGPVKLGSIIWSGTYKERIANDGTTAPSVQEFIVTGTSGIYSDVTRVIIDFNNIVRVLYFIGPKKC